MRTVLTMTLICCLHQDMNLNWASVIKSFDWADRHGVDTATLKMLIAILLNSPRNIDPHAVTGFWETWSNSLYQLRLLDALLSLPADTFNFVQLPGHRIVTVDDVSIASPTIKSLAANVQGQTWNSLELFQMLVRLADSESPEICNCVREMLDKAIKISAEIVHMGLLQVPVRLVFVHLEVYLICFRNPPGMTSVRSMPTSCLRCFLLDIPITNSFSCVYGKYDQNISRLRFTSFTMITRSISPAYSMLLKILRYCSLSGDLTSYLNQFPRFSTPCWRSGHLPLRLTSLRLHHDGNT
jgi:hypothetical protein